MYKNKNTEPYSINWSPFLMSCCLVLLSSDTLDMLSWTSTFWICNSSKRKEEKRLLACSSWHVGPKDPISQQQQVDHALAAPCLQKTPSMQSPKSNTLSASTCFSWKPLSNFYLALLFCLFTQDDTVMLVKPNQTARTARMHCCWTKLMGNVSTLCPLIALHFLYLLKWK